LANVALVKEPRRATFVALRDHRVAALRP
jgi:hypothetical protein